MFSTPDLWPAARHTVEVRWAKETFAVAFDAPTAEDPAGGVAVLVGVDGSISRGVGAVAVSMPADCGR